MTTGVIKDSKTRIKQGKPNWLCLLAKPIYTYIHRHTKINQEEPFWDILTILGTLLLYTGCLLLLYDYFILNTDNIYTYGAIQNLPLFIASQPQSKLYICNTNQGWLPFILIGGGFQALGKYMPREKPCLKKKNQKKNIATTK